MYHAMRQCCVELCYDSLTIVLLQASFGCDGSVTSNVVSSRLATGRRQRAGMQIHTEHTYRDPTEQIKHRCIKHGKCIEICS